MYNIVPMYSFSSNKYKAKPMEVDGVFYASQKEYKHTTLLNARVQNGELIRWEAQPQLMFFLHGRKICGYRMDYITWRTDGVIELIEVKGMSLPDWRIRWRLLQALVDTKQFREDSGLPVNAKIELVLDASRRVQNWSNGIRNPKRQKRKKS